MLAKTENRQKSLWLVQLLGTLCLGLSSVGCYAPLHSPGIPAASLPDSFRTPYRSVGAPLNFAELTLQPPENYTLDANDVLEVYIPDLYEGAEIRPLRLQVLASGDIQLPLVGPLNVKGMNLQEAQQEITNAYAQDTLKNPSVNVTLAEKSPIEVLVLGEVNMPGVHSLSRFQNDIGHALASAGGLSEDAEPMIEIHRKRNIDAVSGLIQADGSNKLPANQVYVRGDRVESFEEGIMVDDDRVRQNVMRIPLRGLEPGMLTAEDITLQPGDVVRIPSRRNDVFFVVGQLNQTNLVRFSLGDRERELGTGLLIPPDRDIDVVTAVVMAGYIDPIDSPTTVTLHRLRPNGSPLLIHVDLIAARSNRCETVLVEPGDIIYINPDAAWYFRRQLDRVFPDLITLPYGQWMSKVIGGGRN